MDGPARGGRGSSLREGLAALVGEERVRTRPIDRIAWAPDASFYRLVPKAVQAGAGGVHN